MAETIELRFYTKDGRIEPSLFDEQALSFAKQLLVKNQNGNSMGISPTQFRRIFDEIKRLKKILDEKKNWQEIYPLLKMVKSKTAYMLARAKAKTIKKEELVKKCYDVLNSFIRMGIDRTKTEADFATFCLLLEAVYAYHYDLSITHGIRDKKPEE